MKTIVNDQCYIIVDDKLSIAVQRYSIAHEIGHILLGDGEYEAERFAIDILAPACVLWGLNLHTAEDIARVCNISITSAQRRAERMRILYDRNMFLSHPLERQVFEQFRDFINNQNK
nr:MAG TPA: IrrE N-terminal-like domain [Caudoviricetes sp.]